MNVARGKRQTKRQKKAVERTEAEQRRDRVIQTLTGRLPTVPASSWFPPATHTRSAQPIPIDGVYLVNPQPDFSQLEHRILAEALRRPASQLTIDSYSMGARVGYTDCPQCPNGRTDRDGGHWHPVRVPPEAWSTRPGLAAIGAVMGNEVQVSNVSSPRTELTLQEAMDASLARGEEGLVVINTRAIRKLEMFSNCRPAYLGDLMKKGGRDIDQIINDRVGDYHSRDKPRDPGFANYLKETYRWSRRGARRQWRALLDRDIDPAVILNARRATWRKMTQNKQTKVATSEQNPVGPLSRLALYSTSSL